MSRLRAIRQRFRAWSRRHSYSFFSSLGALMQHRLGTLMTVLVLGIAILLPLGLHITLMNLDRLELGEEQWGSLTVFTQAETTEAEASALADRIRAQEAVDGLDLVSPTEGMREFREASGFGASLEMLEHNPLPWVLSVTLKVGEGDRLETLADELVEFVADQPEVASVQYDHKWLQRLGRLLALGRASVSVLVLLFSLAVIVVVANTIRLDVATRAEEIEVQALVGANNGFIRQPFLYSGFWYGLLGGLVAMVLANIALVYLDVPFGRLLDSYGQQVSLLGPGLRQIGAVLLACGLLGLLGAWISVQRHLRLLRVGGSLGRR
jgi:cell division transport system permease protein